MAATTSAMRGNSRSPPFVVVGLVLTLLILAFYYWKLSTRNSDLEFLLDEQKSIVRMEFSKRANNEQRMDTLMNNLKACQDLVEKDKAIIIEKESTLKSVTEQLQTKEDEFLGMEKNLNQCKTNLKKCQDDTTGVKQQSDKLKEESDKKDKELKALKETPAAQCNCDQPLLDQRKSIENILQKAVGDQAIQALRANGFPQPGDQNQPPKGFVNNHIGIVPARFNDDDQEIRQNPSHLFYFNRKIDGAKEETPAKEVKAKNEAMKDENGGGHAAEVKDENGEKKEDKEKKNEEKKNGENKDEQEAENNAGEADDDVVGKKVIDEADGRDGDTLQFRPIDESLKDAGGD